jgi:hypothetical protein
MTQQTTPFKLHAPDLSPDSAVTEAGDLPAEVAGQAASYFWKDMIHAGNYRHPTKGFSLAVNRQRLQRWAETGEQMLAAGVAIPINCDHSDAARDVVGYVKQFKLDGDQLLGLCQFIGDDAALTAARNSVSVGIDPDFTDGQGRKWGEAVVHLALTPVPVVPDQDEFVQMANEEEMPNAEGPGDEAPGPGQMPNENKVPALPCTAEQFARLRDLIGRDVAAEQCVSRIIERLQQTSLKEPSPEPSPGVPGEGERLKAELAAAREEVLQLSARIPPAMPGDVEAAMTESTTAKFEAAVARGSLSPAARDRLVATLVRGGDGKANVIALSRSANPGGDRCLAMAVAEILLDNEPIRLGETTGLQAMPRQIPGEESSSIEQLRQYMTKIASVSG